MLRHRASTRKVAGLLLLLWVFALGVSIAHACGIAPHDSQHDHHSASLLIGAYAAAPEAAHEDGPSHDPGHEPCAKFCDDLKAASNPPQNGADLPTPGMLSAPPGLRVHDEPVVVELIPARAREPSNRPPLPIAIEYLRLAL